MAPVIPQPPILWETELAERFPIRVVTAWLGSTPEIARKHYLQITEDHFRQAAETWDGNPESALQPALRQTASSTRKSATDRGIIVAWGRDSDNPAQDANAVSCETLRRGALHTQLIATKEETEREGREHPQESPENPVIAAKSGAESGALPPDSAPIDPDLAAPIDPDLAALIDAWPTLSVALKAGIVAMVRAAGGATK